MALYLVPMIGQGSEGDPRRPAYIDVDAPFVDYSVMDYGNEPWCLVALAPTPAQHAVLVTRPQVFALPENLDQPLGANVVLVKNILAARNIPEDWAESSFTYRQILRVLVALFAYAQRLARHRAAPLFEGSVTLASRWNQLPAAVRTALRDAAVSLGYDVTSLSGITSLRALLKAMADQSPLLEVTLGEERL